MEEREVMMSERPIDDNDVRPIHIHPDASAAYSCDHCVVHAASRFESIHYASKETGRHGMTNACPPLPSSLGCCPTVHLATLHQTTPSLLQTSYTHTQDLETRPKRAVQSLVISISSHALLFLLHPPLTRFHTKSTRGNNRAASGGLGLGTPLIYDFTTPYGMHHYIAQDNTQSLRCPRFL